MPKVKRYVDPRETALRAEIGAIRGELQITQGEMARRAGITPATMCNRMKSIGDLRMSEYWALQDIRGKR